MYWYKFLGNVLSLWDNSVLRSCNYFLEHVLSTNPFTCLLGLEVQNRIPGERVYVLGKYGDGSYSNMVLNRKK